MADIMEAEGPGYQELARELFVEYADGLGFPLDFQDFDQELATLPGRYAPPGGVILLAMERCRAAGCVAMRPLSAPGVCEMKRLYVRPQYRGLKLGSALAQAVIEKARQASYSAMRLDTLPVMDRAIALYERLGFKDIAPYCHNPHEGARYLELTL